MRYSDLGSAPKKDVKQPKKKAIEGISRVPISVDIPGVIPSHLFPAGSGFRNPISDDTTPGPMKALTQVGFDMFKILILSPFKSGSDILHSIISYMEPDESLRGIFVGQADTLQTIEISLTVMNEAITSSLQSVLDRLTGVEVSTLEEKQDIARRIQNILSTINRRVKCTACGAPSALRVVKSLSSETGVFQFDHSNPKRSTHQGGSTFPVLKIVEAPEDRRKAKHPPTAALLKSRLRPLSDN